MTQSSERERVPGLGLRVLREVRKLSGHLESPRQQVLPFRMFSRLDEQHILTNDLPEKIFSLLRKNARNSRIVAQAIYDMFYALDDRNTAKFLVDKSVKAWGAERTRMDLSSAVLLRIHTDKASVEEQVPFQEFCRDQGLEIASVTLEDARKFYREHDPDPLRSLLRDIPIGNY
jgi:hypothetical protein